VTLETDPTLLPLDEVLERSDVLIIAAPHKAYAALAPSVHVIDVWNQLGRGVKA
jgi:UDP-N-acetyl-D-mannosaminuronic acid dehydrogenase